MSSRAAAAVWRLAGRPVPVAGLGLLLMLVVPAAATTPLRDFALPGSAPNIFFLLADDWPYEMWPSVTTDDHGAPTNYTGLLPSIARNFVEDAMDIDLVYAQPMSAPSRRSLFSGRFMTQVGKPFGGINSLSTGISTFPERLKSAGYATFIAGKVRTRGTNALRKSSRPPPQARRLCYPE